jgi:hypothetical protein
MGNKIGQVAMGRQAAEMLVKLLISLPKAFKAVLMSRMEGEIKGTHALYSFSTAAKGIAIVTHTARTHTRTHTRTQR